MTTNTDAGKTLLSECATLATSDLFFVHPKGSWNVLAHDYVMAEAWRNNADTKQRLGDAESYLEAAWNRLKDVDGATVADLRKLRDQIREGRV